jgi:hypothetical protein
MEPGKKHPELKKTGAKNNWGKFLFSLKIVAFPVGMSHSKT